MIDHLLMLTCGWVGGVASTLLIRHALDGRRPLDPALLPTPFPLPAIEAWHKRNPPPPDFSPYAPKPKRTWQAPKQERITRWVTNAAGATGASPAPTPQIVGAGSTVAEPASALKLPSIAWGTPHGGEGQTLTQEVRAQSDAENGHSAQTPRHRA